MRTQDPHCAASLRSSSLDRHSASNFSGDTSDAFVSFARRRALLNDQLDDTKRAIDSWFERQPQPAPMGALANLEVLLKTRRDLLAELVDLDDEFMLHLIQMRSTGSGT